MGKKESPLGGLVGAGWWLLRAGRLRNKGLGGGQIVN